MLHQLEGGQYLEKNNGGFLYVEQRGGKTLMAILGSYPNDDKQFLIVTRKSIMHNWRAELILASVPPESILIAEGSKKRREGILDLDNPVIICNYNMLKSYRVIDKRLWDIIIFDESIAIANGSSAVTRYVLRAMNRQRLAYLTKPGGKYMCLSGSPAPESPVQFATQFLAIEGTYFGCDNIADYLYTFWKQDDRDKWHPKNPLHLVQIKQLIKEKCFVRTLEELNLGSRRFYSRRYVPMTTVQAVQITLVTIHKEKGKISEETCVLYMNMLASGINPWNKAYEWDTKVKDLLEYYKENPEPMLVLSFFKTPIYCAEALFMSEDIKCALIHGDIPLEERERIRQDFQEGKLDIVFGQTDTVKEGLDFSRASLTVYLNNSFSSNTRNQSEMRTTNVTKKEPVQIMDYCTENTLDSAIVNCLVNKKEVSNEFLINESTNIGGQYGNNKKNR